MMSDSCIFCKIAAGEIPSATLYEDEDFRVIFDIAPASKGHAIMLPKKHGANLFELDEEVCQKVLPVAKKVGNAMIKAFHCDGLNLVQNNGEAAGQTVFHFHLHLIPRYQDDHIGISSWKQGSAGPEELEAMTEAVRKALEE